MKKILILLLISLSAIGQQRVNGVRLVVPNKIIDSLDTKHAALGWVNNFFVLKRYGYYRSDNKGKLYANGGWVSNRSFDSSQVAIPAGWTNYELPCDEDAGSIIANWQPGTFSYPLYAKTFNGKVWLIQTDDNFDTFVIRGWNMLDRTDVTTTRQISTTCVKGGLVSGIGGLLKPADFTTPEGYINVEESLYEKIGLSNPCLGNQLIAQWQPGNEPYNLESRKIGDSLYLIQPINSTSFTGRAWNMLERTDVTIINNLLPECESIKGGLVGEIGGLVTPPGFPTPDGYEIAYNSDGIYFRVIGSGGDNGGGGGTLPTSGDIAAKVVDVWSNVIDSPENRYFTGYAASENVASRANISLPDFLPVQGVAAKLKNENYKYKGFEEVFIRERSVVENYVHNGIKYYVRPNHEYNNTQFMPDLASFPNIQIPNNKIFIDNCNFEAYNGTGLLKRLGNTFVSNDSSTPFSETSYHVADGWLLELGMPQMYADQVNYNGVVMNRKDAFDLWCADVDANQLLQSFQRNFGWQAGRGHLQWNAEDNIGIWTVDRWKIENCFIWWRQQNYNAKLSAWSQAPFMIYQARWFNEPIDWNNVQEQGYFFGGLWMNDFFRNIDIWESGDYINRWDHGGHVHHALTDFLINKHFRNVYNLNHIKIMTTAFPSMECQVDAYQEPNNIERIGRNGVKYYQWQKPSVFPQSMYNLAVWMVAVGDGINFWDSPNMYKSDRDDEYGYGWSPELNGFYDVRHPSGNHTGVETRKQMNYAYWGLHAITTDGNREIIEDQTTEWQWGVMPDVANFEQRTLVAWKKSNGKTLALVMGHASAGNSTRSETVTIDGQNYDVLLHGQWTSVIRLDNP